MGMPGKLQRDPPILRNLIGQVGLMPQQDTWYLAVHFSQAAHQIGFSTPTIIHPDQLKAVYLPMDMVRVSFIRTSIPTFFNSEAITSAFKPVIVIAKNCMNTKAWVQTRQEGC